MFSVPAVFCGKSTTVAMDQHTQSIVEIEFYLKVGDRGPVLRAA
jgi:hypothetical protein